MSNVKPYLLTISLTIILSFVFVSEAQLQNQFTKPAFWGTRLVNLPTTNNIGKHDVLFRISHRFVPTVRSGYDNSYFGLNGPAYILLSLGFGIRKDLSVTVAHANSYHEWEFGLKWSPIEQGKNLNVPLSMAVNISGSWVTLERFDRDRLSSENMKFNLQFILSRQFSNTFSFMIVPAYSSNTNHWAENSEGTFGLGTGVTYSIFKNFAVVGEWIPVLSGYKAEHRGWGLGVEYKVGGHVFHIFITNNDGLTTDQFLPGGDLDINENDYRFGFNIFRTFWF